jgi:CRP-like cAMP-binding protein
VRLLRANPDPAGGHQPLLALLRAGDLFGEVLRPPEATMEDYAIAQGEAEVWSIEGRDLRALVEARPPLAMEIIRGLNERHRALRRRVNALTFRRSPPASPSSCSRSPRAMASAVPTAATWTSAT